MTDHNNPPQDNDNLAPADATRRDLLKKAFQVSAAAAAGSALMPEAASAGLFGIGNFRIDVHCHHIPDFYRASMAAHGITTAGGVPIPPWSPELAVDFMNKYDIQTQVVSIYEPGVTYFPTASERVSLARQINDYTTYSLIGNTSLTMKNRFGGFAVLPLGEDNTVSDIANASAEAIRAYDTLKMDGIGIFSNYGGVYLGDPLFEPLMATLNMLGAMVFLHPVTPNGYPNLGLPTFLYEFPFDTTRAVTNMLYKGVFKRYPNIRWLLAHAGGAVPFLSYRTSLLTIYPVLAQNLGISALDNGNLAYAKLFYDTALSPAPAAMKSVREVTSVSHIMFATDWPFSSQIFVVPGDPAPQLSETFSSSERYLVERSNALVQFPRVAARLGS